MKDGIYINRRRTRDYKHLIEVTIRGGNTNEPDCFYQADIPSVGGHFLIEHRSPYGGGSGGWDEVVTLVGIAHSKLKIPKKVYECALKYAKGESKRLKLPVMDRITRRESKLVDLARK